MELARACIGTNLLTRDNYVKDGFVVDDFKRVEDESGDSGPSEEEFKSYDSNSSHESTGSGSDGPGRRRFGFGSAVSVSSSIVNFANGLVLQRAALGCPECGRCHGMVFAAGQVSEWGREAVRPIA